MRLSRWCEWRNVLCGLLAVLLLYGTPTAALGKTFAVVRTGVFALRTDLLMVALAKELCTCVNVSRLGESQPIDQATGLCLERAQLPMTPGLIKALTGVSIDQHAGTVEVDPSLLGAIASLFQGGAALATYDNERPQYGCSLIDGPRLKERLQAPRFGNRTPD